MVKLYALAMKKTKTFFVYSTIDNKGNKMLIISAMISILLLILAFYRFIVLTYKISKKQLILKQTNNGIMSLIGGLGYIVLLLAILSAVGVTILTFFYMREGSGSGVLFALATMIFPLVYGVSEFLISLGFVKNNI